MPMNARGLCTRYSRTLWTKITRRCSRTKECNSTNEWISCSIFCISGVNFKQWTSKCYLTSFVETPPCSLFFSSEWIPGDIPKWVNCTRFALEFTIPNALEFPSISKIHSLKSEHIHSFLFREYWDRDARGSCPFLPESVRICPKSSKNLLEFRPKCPRILPVTKLWGHSVPLHPKSHICSGPECNQWNFEIWNFELLNFELLNFELLNSELQFTQSKMLGEASPLMMIDQIIIQQPPLNGDNMGVKNLSPLRSTGVTGGGGGLPPPHIAFSEFCRYIWKVVGTCNPTSMSFVPTQYLKYQQNIEIDNSFRMSNAIFLFV